MSWARMPGVDGRWLVTFALLIALMAGCTSDDGVTATTPAPTGSLTATPATPAPDSSASPPATTELNPEIPTVVPLWIEDLELVTDSSMGEPFPHFITYPSIPGAEPFNEAVAAVVQEQLDLFAEHFPPDGPTPPPDAMARPELNVTFEFIVASGDVVGVRLPIFEFFGANGQMRAVTVWYDGASREALQSVDLLAGQTALEELAALSEEILIRDRSESILPDVLEQGAAPTAENYDSLGFDAAGRLIVLFDEIQVGIAAAGPISIAIEAEDAEPLLSDFGRRVRDETVSPSGVLNLATPTATVAPPPPTPEPTTPVPTASPTTGRVDCDAEPCIALTFDDGPGSYTAQLLDTLAARGVRVTFFTVGINVAHLPELTARAAAEGHEIGNHTWEHRDLTLLSADLIHEQVDRAQAAIADATGNGAGTLRPPYGATNEVVASNVGLPQIIWTVDTRDWADRDSEIVTSRALEGAAPGVIILMHDIHETTVNAVPAIVDGLLAEGYTLVTVSELLAGRELEPGEVYSRH